MRVNVCVLRACADMYIYVCVCVCVCACARVRVGVRKRVWCVWGWMLCGRAWCVWGPVCLAPTQGEVQKQLLFHEDKSKSGSYMRLLDEQFIMNPENTLNVRIQPEELRISTLSMTTQVFCFAYRQASRIVIQVMIVPIL